MTNNLKAWLAEREITQVELAQRLGYKQPTVSRAVNGYLTPGFIWRFTATYGHEAAAAVFNGKKEN